MVAALTCFVEIVGFLFCHVSDAMNHQPSAETATVLRIISKAQSEKPRVVSSFETFLGARAANCKDAFILSAYSPEEEG